MNNNSLDHNQNFVVNIDYNPSGVNKTATPLSQQKRQSSLSNYALNNPNKRTVTSPLQVANHITGGYDNLQELNPNFQSGHATPDVIPSRYKSAVTNSHGIHSPNLQYFQTSGNQSMLNPSYNKTPTPSSHEMPFSPKFNQISNVSANNNSDLSESNLVDLLQRKNFQDISEMSKASESATVENQSMIESQQRLGDGEGSPQDTSSSTYQQKQRVMTDEEQQLATKLKETYKNIVNYEEIVQKNCMEISIKINNITTNGSNNPMVYGSQVPVLQLSSSLTSHSSMSSRISKTSELLNDLWTAYHNNIALLDNYYDFFLTALKPTSNLNQFKTGKNIVELYKIPRRMWVYGIVGFLEVLKHIIGIFHEHEICLCFIAHCFNIISNLTDPFFEMEGWWAEKLGDLSRMAIALYYSRLIDWKISAEYWYSVAMRTMYGHGKVYYHMCTVQQDNLDALVNIGKSVICNDPFVPTQQYLRLVVENICTQRIILSLLELPIIDFIKIHKVLLTIHFSTQNNEKESASTESIRESQLQYGIDLVTRYGLTFGSDSNGYNFFTKELYHSNGMAYNDSQHSFYLQQQQSNANNSLEKVNFWFNKGPSFALANINHLVGFGDPKNPFAKIFELPEALKERKDRKDKKRKSRSASTYSESAVQSATLSDVDGHFSTAEDLSKNEWFCYLRFINKSVLELSIRIFRHYLVGPRQASTGHVIVWLYFLVAVGEAAKKYPQSEFMFYWLLRKLLPMESLINYLNSILSIVKSNRSLHALLCSYLTDKPNYMKYFNENEFLPEVWKCWGTLWFDMVSFKSDYQNLEEAGVSNYDIFDIPSSGNSSTINQAHQGTKMQSKISRENEERIIRVLLLARHIADNYNFGIVRGHYKFQFDKRIYSSSDIFNSSTRQPEVYAYVEEFLLGDNRFIQNNFLEIVSGENLVDVSSINMAVEEKDEIWFNLSRFRRGQHTVENGFELDDHMADNEEEMEGYADYEFEDEFDYDAADPLDSKDFLHQSHENIRQLEEGGSMYYQEAFSANSHTMDQDSIMVEGNLGDRMDTSITYITLDTNVWLKHCGRVYTCVRNNIIKVLIPLIVFQELRLLRKSAEATISDAATRSVIIIRELYLSSGLLPLRFDGTIASDINETTEFESNANWRANIDDMILNSVNENDEISKKLMKGMNMVITSPFKGKTLLDPRASKIFRYCILITDDRNMRLRAKALGLTSFQSKWLFAQLESVFPQKCID